MPSYIIYKKTKQKYKIKKATKKYKKIIFKARKTSKEMRNWVALS